MDQILGQPRAIDMLQASLGSGRLHHAYIFHGPVGVGKFTTARAFGKILLCHDPQRDLAGRVIACEACESCRLLGDPQAVHPDFIVVTKELARYHDDSDVRKRKLMNIPKEVLDAFFLVPAYRAAQLRHNRVLVIDEAELMDGPGQNSLLKTLEEPPAGMYLILVTSSEDRLLPTIRSRCQRVAFIPLPEEEIGRWVNKQEAVKGWKDHERLWLIGFAAGSLGRAGLALEYGLVDWAKAVLPALEKARQGHYPVGLGARVAELIDTFAERWVKEHEGASKEAANKLAASLMWSLIAQHARRQMAREAAKLPAGELEGGDAALGPWLGVIDAVAGAEMELASNVNMGLVCDHLFALVHRSLAA